MVNRLFFFARQSAIWLEERNRTFYIFNSFKKWKCLILFTVYTPGIQLVITDSVWGRVWDLFPDASFEGNRFLSIVASLLKPYCNLIWTKKMPCLSTLACFWISRGLNTIYPRTHVPTNLSTIIITPQKCRIDKLSR